MSTHELRAEARIPVTQRGSLSTGNTWFPCVIVNMSSSGFLMVSNKQLEVGQTLDFRCELYPGRFLDCMIEVMHANDDSAGMMITEIDDNASRLLQVYLKEKLVRPDAPLKAKPEEDK